MGFRRLRFDFPHAFDSLPFPPHSHHPTAVCANHFGGVMATVGDGVLGVVLSTSPTAAAAAQNPGTTAAPGQALKTTHPLAAPALPQTQLGDRWLATDHAASRVRDKQQSPSFASDVPSVTGPVCIDAGTSMRRSRALETDRGNEGNSDDDDECKVARESEGTRTGHRRVQARNHQPTANVAGCSRMSLRLHKKRETGSLSLVSGPTPSLRGGHHFPRPVGCSRSEDLWSSTFGPVLRASLENHLRNGSKIICRRTLRKHIQIMPKVVRRLLLGHVKVKAGVLNSTDDLRHLLETQRVPLLEIYKERGGLSGSALDKATKKKRTSINHLLNFVELPLLKEDYTDFAAHNAEREKRLAGGQQEHRGCRSIARSFSETPAGHPVSAISASPASSSSMAAVLWPASSASSMTCYGGSAAMPLRAPQGANQSAPPDHPLLTGARLSKGALLSTDSSSGGMAAATATANAGERIAATSGVAPSPRPWPSSSSSCPVLPSYSEQLALAKVLSNLATAGGVESRYTSSNESHSGSERIMAVAQDRLSRSDALRGEEYANLFRDSFPGRQHDQGSQQQQHDQGSQQQQLQHLHVPPYALYANHVLPNVRPAIVIPPPPPSQWLPSQPVTSSVAFLKAGTTLQAAGRPVVPIFSQYGQGLPDQSAPPRID